MPDPETRIAESRRISRLLVLASERAKSGFAASIAPFGLPIPLSRALLMLGEPMSMRDLADLMVVDPSYITGLADQLEARGLITRVPGADRRVKLLAATDDGHTLRASLLAALTEREMPVERLTAPERATLAALLERLLAE